jgi:hypothetical protein
LAEIIFSIKKYLLLRERNKMELLTLGQVIDNMQMDEVAIKVKGKSGECEVEGYDYLTTGLYFDEDDSNILKSLEDNEVDIAKVTNKADISMFRIIKRKDYKDTLK